MFENNVTIMKYKTPNNEYKFEVMDKFDEPDEVIRLDKMLALSRKLDAEGKLSECLWIKNTPVI